MIYDLVKTYSWLITNYNMGGGIKQYDRHCRDLAGELVNRQLLTTELVTKLMDA